MNLISLDQEKSQHQNGYKKLCWHHGLLDAVSDTPALGPHLLGKGKIEGIQELEDQEIGEKIRKSLLEKGQLKQ